MPHYRIASVVALVCLLAPPTLVASSAQVVELDSTTLDRRYDGFGGLSGGGATSRLLPDYPDPQRGEVLDLLFKPFWGASLHMLKVEIGGATFSGCGTEPTHALNATDLNLHRGYEWWLAREASARNPSVLGYALSWGFPHWIGAQNGGRPLTPQQAAYTASFCAGASSVAGAWGCDFVGVWNERDWSSDYIIELRAALDAANLSATRVVVADGGWDPVAALAANDTLRAAVYAVGVHYPSGSNSTPAAVALDLPLWASEDSSTYFDASGGGCLTRILSWNVIYGSMTSTVIWNLVSSYYDHLRWYGDSLMAASSPWSGSYADAAPLWSAAHWTQFAWPGWTFLPVARAHGGRGGAGELPSGGTYVTLVDTTGTSEVVEAGVLAAVAAAAARGDPPPSRADLAALRRSLHELTLATGEAFVPPTRARAGGVPPRPRPSTPLHWTLILETTTAPHSQCIRSNPARAWDVAAEQNITFVLDSGLQLPSAVVAWKTVHFTSAGERGVSWFQRLPDIPVDVGSRSFTVVGLHPDTALTVASVDRGQRHGAPPAPPPPRAPFPSPYADDFAETPIDGMPRYFSDHAGSWAARPRRDGAPRSAYEQLVTEQPVGWDDNADDSLYPFTIIGDWNASDADIGADAYVADYATYHPGGGGGDPLVSLAPCVAGDAAQMWVLNASAAIALPGSVIAHDSGQCLDVDGCATPPGTPLWMWPCVTSAPGTNCESKNQLWDLDGTTGHLVTRMDTGYCLTAADADASAAVAMQPCGAAPPALQAFTHDAASGLLRAGGAGAGLCLRSRPPPPVPLADDTHVGLALRLGGMTARSTVAEAYESTWYNFGYFFSVRPDRTWAVTKGAGTAATTAPAAEAAVSAATATAASTSGATVRRASRRHRDSGRRGAGVDGVGAGPRPSFRGDARIVLANGTLPAGAMGLRQWHSLRFTARGAQLTAAFDGVVLARVTDASFPVGWAALTSGWHAAQFANFTMTHSS